MQITIDSGSRIVSVWLTNAEKQDGGIRQELKSLCAINKERKYQTAVFLSGSRDLTNCTQSLILHNRLAN